MNSQHYLTSPPKNLLLGVTGGIAAYKAAELVRLLVGSGVSVQVVMTKAATQFVAPLTFQALSGKPVLLDAWQAEDNGMGHIALSRQADAILIAPASADFIAKIQHGLADDLLSTLCLARNCPLILAPAMNQHMWLNPATQRNIQQLQQDGVILLGPATGAQACGETGPGRMLEPAEIHQSVLNIHQPQLLKNQRVLVTAGPTREPIDPVRVITNNSSGKMGYSIAEIAAAMGADVTLISGPVALGTTPLVRRVMVNTAQEMAAAVMAEIAGQTIFISVAAVSDYRPATPATEKIKKNSETLSLELVRNEDILAKVARLQPAPFCVGFAAESQDLLNLAREKRLQKNIPLIAANLVSDAVASDHNTLTLIDKNGEHPLPSADKKTVARGLLEHVVKLMESP